MDVLYQLTLSSPFYSQAYARFAHAELLRELGRNDEARRWYATLPGTAPDELVYLGPVHLGQATMAERLGRRDEAVAHYRRFVELWKDCDPELRPLLDNAQRQLARLTGS